MKLSTKMKLNKIKLEEINIDHILISEFNVRKSRDDEELKNLAKSINEHGLLQPIIVMLKGVNNYELIAGQRRLKACKSLDIKSIPAIIIENADELKVLTLSTVENLQRLDLNVAEKMEAFSNIYELYENDLEQVAQAIGYAIETVKKYIKLNAKLDPSLKAEIKEGKRNPPLRVLEELINSENIPVNEQAETLDRIGPKKTEEIVEKLQRINKAQDRKEMHDEFKGETEVNELIKLFLTERREKLSSALKKLDIRRYLGDFYRELDKLKNESPLIKIFNLKAAIGSFESFFRRTMNIEDIHDRYNTQANFKILLEEYKKNNERYSLKFKNDFSRILKKLSDLDLFKQIIKNFDLKLID